MINKINLTGKQKRHLRAMGNSLEPIMQIGKGGISENSLVQVEEALEARELIKVRVLNNCSQDVREVASLLSEKTTSHLVQVVGRNLLLFRPSSKKQIIELP